MRKKLSKTQREIVIGKDKSRCHGELLVQSRAYPFDVYCPGILSLGGPCHKVMEYEDDIIFHKKSKVDKFVEKLIGKMDVDTRRTLLNEYDRLKE